MSPHPVARVALIAVLVAACGGAVATPTPPPVTPIPVPTRIPGLEATLWKLVSVNGTAAPADGQGAAGLEIGSPGIAGDVRGSGPCGELQGQYMVAGPGGITFDVKSTKDGECDAATKALRADYLTDLLSATTWAVDGTKLTLSGKGELVFENQANHL